MNATTVSEWKERLDRASSLEEAEEIVEEALKEASRQELLEFLEALYTEFIGPDHAGGGESGTLERMRRIAGHTDPSHEDLIKLGISPKDLEAYLSHA